MNKFTIVIRTAFLHVCRRLLFKKNGPRTIDFVFEKHLKDKATRRKKRKAMKRVTWDIHALGFMVLSTLS